MGSVSSIFAHRMVQAAGEVVDAPALLRSVGLEPDASLDVALRIGDDVYYDLLERIVTAMGDNAHELPLRVGPLMRLDDYGALGLAWKSAPTVRHSLERVERFCRLWTDNMTYELRDEPSGTLFVLHRAGERRLGMRLSNEATLSSATSLIRQSAAFPPFAPRAVYARHPAPGSTAEHEAYFGCPVHFGAPVDALRIADADLDRPNQLADDGISRFLLSHLETEIESIDSEGVESLVQRVVMRSLSEGVPRMTDVARRLGMSERTLHRRLSEKSLTFKRVAEQTRRDLAQSLLHEERYSLAEVAFLTGFSEQSAFNRAFKRWAGQTPAAFRRSAISSA